MPKTPKLGTNASATSKAMPTKINEAAPKLMGSTDVAIRAKIKQMEPITPGKIDPGWVNSNPSPIIPAMKSK